MVTLDCPRMGASANISPGFSCAKIKLLQKIINTNNAYRNGNFMIGKIQIWGLRQSVFNKESKVKYSGNSEDGSDCFEARLNMILPHNNK